MSRFRPGPAGSHDHRAASPPTAPRTALPAARGAAAGVPLFLRRPADPTAGAPQAAALDAPRPLDPRTRTAMEARLGEPLDDVRVHAGPESAAAALALGAHAFTVGRDVVFGDGHLAPDGEEGRRLLLHELAHVVQQRAPAGAARADDAAPRHAERDAERVARAPEEHGVHVRARTPVRAAADPRPGAPTAAELEKTYKVRIVQGDKGWSDDELADLAWSLGRLSKEERAIVRGYDFQRWSTPGERAEKDPSYTPTGKDECGLHEITLGGTVVPRITMYDDCFDASTTMGGQPIARFNILHEVGHAAESARGRRARAKQDAAQQAYDDAYTIGERANADYNAANDARNALVDEFNAETDAKKRAALEPEVKKAIRKADKLQKQAEAAEKVVARLEAKADEAEKATDRALAEPGKTLEELTEGEDPLTKYSEEGTEEAFAEAFALYKLDPKALAKRNKRLHDWFAKHGELTGAAAPPKPKAKK